MRVGVTGHQKREGIDWDWTRIAIEKELAALTPPIEGWSALAVGADQLCARAVLERGGCIVTVVPGEWYEECFEGVPVSPDPRRWRSRGVARSAWSAARAARGPCPPTPPGGGATR